MIIDGWTASQRQRFKELGIASAHDVCFDTVELREAEFSRIVTANQSEGRKIIKQKLSSPERHPLALLEETLTRALIDEGFVEVRTPTIISKSALVKMGIGDDHPLHEQVFWLDEKRCLRPMLAPNLYYVMRHLLRISRSPVKLFEVGTCYRKESKGSNHLEEFTMLNLVELAPEGEPLEQLYRHVSTVMDAAGLEYELRDCESDVYVQTVDVEVNGMEVASGAVGPHKLDPAHGITDAWAGVGFGLERLLQVKSGENNIKKVGRSLIYFGGVRLDI